MANSASGTVNRIYVNDDICYIRLTYAAQSANTPKPINEYFHLLRSAPNYNAQYSLALSSAINQNELTIRAVDDIDPNSVAVVGYLVGNY